MLLRAVHALTVALLVSACGLDTMGDLSFAAADGSADMTGADGGTGAPGADGGSVSADSAMSVGADSASAPETSACSANLATDPKNCGACGHDCAAGSCASGACQPYTLVTVPGHEIRAVAVNATNLFWLDITDPANNFIVQADLQGSGASPVVTGLSRVFEIMLGPGGLYYTDGDIHLLTLGGWFDTDLISGTFGCVWFGPSTTLATDYSASDVDLLNVINQSATPIVSPMDGVSQPWGVALTPSFLYWTNSGVGVAGSIMRRPVPSGAITTVRDGLPNPSCLNFDEKGLLYWPNYDDGTIHRSNPDGSNDTTLASAQVDPTIIAITADFLYWNSGDSVARLAR